jgi:hypothetical protein
MKIDTQGMSYGDGKGSGKSLEEQRAAIPPFNPPKIPIITDAMKKELKAIINEVLDEREYERKLNGPYDMIEPDLEMMTVGLDEDIDITPAMLDDAYAHHFTGTVGIDTSGMFTLDDLDS